MFIFRNGGLSSPTLQFYTYKLIMSKSPLQGSLTADRGTIAPLNSHPPYSYIEAGFDPPKSYPNNIAVRSCLPNTVLLLSSVTRLIFIHLY